jgi:hypothetical protein
MTLCWWLDELEEALTSGDERRKIVIGELADVGMGVDDAPRQ